MPTSVVFQLERPSGVYMSGECVRGRILVKTFKTKRINSVYVILEGEAKVQWSISTKTESANYYGHQQYLYTRTNVLYQAEFRAGIHVYNFALRIPAACPSTCKAPYGFIAYKISLTIDKPWIFNEIFHKSITIVQTLNLNANPEYALPVKDECIKYLCSWPCTSGPIAVTLLVPYCGFVPSQQIPFYLEVDNQSPHYDVASVEAILNQHFVFMARKPFKRNYYTKQLAKSTISEHTLKLTKRLYEGSVQVPDSTQRSTLNPTYIVFLHYTLQLRLKTGYFHYDIEISVPVVIGSVPLREQQQLVTTQPTLRQRVEGEDEAAPAITTAARVMPELGTTTAIATAGDEFTHPTIMSLEELEYVEEDEPPSYDSCLPPSFSFATLGSQQMLEHSTAGGSAAGNGPKERVERAERIAINLPPFPGYNTFAVSAQAIDATINDSALDLNCYQSYGSLNTDHTGRSLDTFAVLSDNDDDADDDV